MAQTVRVAQDASYVARYAAQFGAIPAGSGGSSGKFVAHAALLLMALTTFQTVNGTSTYTGPNGTATVGAQQLSVVIIQNTNTTSGAVTLATTTIGPFLAGGQGTSGLVGGSNQYALNTAAGTSGQGGVPVAQGAQFFVVSGTDATAANLVTVDYQIASQAPLTL